MDSASPGMESTTLSYLSQRQSQIVSNQGRMSMSISKMPIFSSGGSAGSSIHSDSLETGRSRLSLFASPKALTQLDSADIIGQFQQMLNSATGMDGDAPLETLRPANHQEEYDHKIHCLEYHKDTVLCVAKCHFLDGHRNVKEYIFSGSQDSSIGVWNTATFQLEGTLLGHSRSILNLYVIKQSALNPLLLSTSRDNCICIWDISSLSLLFRITGLPSLVYDVEVLSFPNNGGYYLYGGCQDTNIFTLNLSVLPFIMQRQYEVIKMEKAYQKQMSALKSRRTKRKRPKNVTSTLSKGMSADSEDDALSDLLLLKRPSILSPKGFKLPWLHLDDDEDEVVENTDNVESTVDGQNGRNEMNKMNEEQQCGGSVTSVIASSKSSSKSPSQSPSKSGLSLNIDSETPSDLTPSPLSPSKMISVNMNFKLPDSTNEIRELISTDPAVVFLSKSVDELIGIYNEFIVGDNDDEKEDGGDNIQFMIHRVFRGCHHGFIFVMKQLHNEYTLITAGSDALIKIWDASGVSSGGVSLQILTVIPGHNHSVVDLGLLGDDHLITASRDETLKVWNISNVQKPHTRYTINGHYSELTAVQVIGDDSNAGTPSLIVSASRNGMVKFWDGRTFQCIDTYIISKGTKSRHDSDDSIYSQNAIDQALSSPNINGISKAWTCDADGFERAKPNCVMRFEFMAPSWLLLCDTAYRVQIWDIAPILKQVTLLHPSLVGSTVASNTNTSGNTEEIEEKSMDKDHKVLSANSADFKDIQSVLASLGLKEYIARFEAEKVDLETLQYLGDTDLIQMDIPLGPRRKIMNHIRSLKMTKMTNSRFGATGNEAHSLSTISEMNVMNSVLNSNITGRSRANSLHSVHSLLSDSIFGNADQSYNIIADLAQFIQYKSISSRVDCRAECWNAAHFIQNKCEQFGAETRLVQGVVGKNPVVLAKFGNLHLFQDRNQQKVKKETVRVVMYGHYDVVDINNESGWTSPPFTLTGKNGYLYGRGSTDNKGPIVVFLHAIRELLEEVDDGNRGNTPDEPQKENEKEKKSVGDVPLEIVMVIEGQEEHDWYGGGLKKVVERNMDWLANPTLVICSNSYWLGDTVPAIVYGMRGHLQIGVTVSGSRQDCHSGVHGGAINEPMGDLIVILSTIKDVNDGRVLIPGFYNDIKPLREDEGALYDDIVRTFTVKDYLQSIGYTVNRNGDNKADAMAQAKLLLMKKWRSPSLSIHNVQQSSNECTVISRSASATISIRTVPDQDNMNIIDLTRDHLKKEFDKLSSMNKLSFTVNNIGPHWLADYNHYIFKCAEKAIVQHWNVEKPHYMREGGTQSCLNYLHHKLKAPTIQFPLGQSSDRAHLENERIRLENLSKGKDVMKSFLLNIMQHHLQNK